MTDPSCLSRHNNQTIAYRQVENEGRPGFIWLGGFKSDMEGTKALALEAWARQNQTSYIRFDYFGHGQSSGKFTDGTISHWLGDALAVLDECTDGPQVLVGSSMGGWIALLAALARPERISGLLLIAPAPDFTEDLMWAQYSPKIKAQLESGQPYSEPSIYDDEPYIITPSLIEDGRQHLLLHQAINLTCPIRIVHGQKDPDVPWQRSLTLADQLNSQNVEITFLKNGDHRLSDEPSLSAILTAAKDLAR